MAPRAALLPALGLLGSCRLMAEVGRANGPPPKYQDEAPARPVQPAQPVQPQAEKDEAPAPPWVLGLLPESAYEPAPAVVRDDTAGGEVPYSPMQWTFGLAWVEREGIDDDPIDSSIGTTVWLAYDLFPGPLRPALELGATWSAHMVDDEPASLVSYRGCAGGKLTLDFEDVPLVLWGRAGWFYRLTVDYHYQSAPYDQDGGGSYVGFGVDWRVSEGVRIGPFVDHFRGSSSGDLEEYFVGIAVTGRL